MSREHTIRSQVSPWVASVAYPLGNHVVLPTYFGRIQVSGQEHLPTTGPVILAPTHQARWDALVVPHVAGPSVTGRYLRFMVSVDEVKGLQGWLIRHLGGFPVNPRQPGIASLRFGLELLLNGEMLVIFPEGGIFRDRQLHPLKPGLARLAVQAEVLQPGLGTRIVPMHIQYDQSLPRWGSNVTVRIGAPLDAREYTHESVKQGARQLTADLRQSLEQLGAVRPAQQLLSYASSRLNH